MIVKIIIYLFYFILTISLNILQKMKQIFCLGLVWFGLVCFGDFFSLGDVFKGQVNCLISGAHKQRGQEFISGSRTGWLLWESGPGCQSMSQLKRLFRAIRLHYYRQYYCKYCTAWNYGISILEANQDVLWADVNQTMRISWYTGWFKAQLS